MVKKLVVASFAEGIVWSTLCCNLSPEEMRERKKEVEEQLPCTGTSHGWEIVLEGALAYTRPCEDIPGFWHYVVAC